MPKINFTPGTRVTAAWLNAIQNLVFDDLAVDGHYPRLTDDALSNAAGSIKPQWYGFRDSLAVTAGSGLSVNYGAGTVTLPDGSLTSIPSGSLSLPNNATSYVYVTSTGTVASSLTYPPLSVPLAKVTTLAGAISGSIQDLRPRYRVQPRPDLLKVFGGLGTDGAYSLTSGTASLNGTKSYTSFYVAAGATLTIPEFTVLRCTGDVVIDGTIVVTPSIRGGQRHIGSYPAAVLPSYVGAGLASAAGVNEVGANTYSYLTSQLGSGGANGYATTSGSAAFIGTRGGNGGGGLVIEAQGEIIIRGSITANGQDGEGILNVTAYPSGVPPANLSVCTGGGGGSGGCIWLKSMKRIFGYSGSSLSVKGGAGGAGYPSSGSCTAGGGGGGYVVAESPDTNLTSTTITLTGGASTIPMTGLGSVPGASYGGQGGGAGQAGGSGQLIVRQALPL